MFKIGQGPTIRILADEDVDGVNIYTDGHFGFVMQKGDKRVCIVEAKKEALEKDMAQGILGCEALADVENLSVVYTVVTNFLEWYFIKDTDTSIYRNVATLDVTGEMPTKESNVKIAGMLYELLSEA